MVNGELIVALVIKSILCWVKIEANLVFVHAIDWKYSVGNIASNGTEKSSRCGEKIKILRWIIDKRMCECVCDSISVHTIAQRL